jgi:6-phosphogluconate dehydrogenase
MELAMIGLGRMGANMTRRLLRGGHRVAAFDLSADAVAAIEKEGATGMRDLALLPQRLKAPRAVWIMVPSGDATEATVERLAAVLEPGDLVIDGGNSWYQDSVRRAERLRAAGIRFLDAGVSGGVWGLENGYSLMVGGAPEDVARMRPVFETLAPAPDRGWGHVGAIGAGHFSKMVHNGIEYGLMQAYAEGFEILRASRYAPDLKQLCDIWSDGSVVRSWLLELAGRAFAADPDLAGLEGHVPDSGEGRWTLAESVDLDVPAPVLYAALMTRFRSRQEDSFQAKVLAALRREFGGHTVTKAPGA